MSLYCVVDDDDLGQVATVQGWSDFIKWANRQGYFQMAHLSQHGYATDIPLLADELHWAIKNSKPPEDVEATARGIEEIARTHWRGEILIITDGDGDDDDEDDEDGDDYPGADNLEDFPDDEVPRPAKKATKKKAKKKSVKKKKPEAPPGKGAAKKKR